MKKLFIYILLLNVFNLLSAQEIVGKWKTYDDNTGEPRSIVEIYKSDDGKYSTLVKL